MEPITFTHLSGENSRADIDRERSDIVTRIYKNKIDCAFRHKYNVTDEQAALLQQYFGPKLVYQDDTPGTKYRDSTHPILAIMNDYSNDVCKREIAHARTSGVKTLSIGDNVRNKNEADHNCLLINDAEQAMRVVHNSSDQTIGYTDYATTKRPTPVCVKGAEKCVAPAQVAFAVHSMYDIKPEQVAQIFANHGLIKMKIYMYIPMSFYDKDLQKLDDNIFNIRKVGDKYLFTMHDFARPYTHDAANWERWAKLTSISGNGWRIVRETSINFGPLHVITLVKIADFVGPIYMSSNLNSTCHSIYKVPSILQAIHNGFINEQRELKHYLVPSHVVDGLLGYAERQENEAYKFNEFATVASGYIRRLKIGGKVFFEAWKPDINEQHDVMISLFIIGANMRADRTKSISNAFQHMKTHINSYSLLYKFRTVVLRIFTDYEKDKSAFDDKTHKLWLYRPYKPTDKTWSLDYKCETNNWDITEKEEKEEEETVDFDCQEVDDTTCTESTGETDDLEIDLKKCQYCGEQYHEVCPCVLKAANRKLGFENKLQGNVITPNSHIITPKFDASRPLNYIQLPRAFIMGSHCAMVSFWDGLPAQAKVQQREIIALVYRELHKLAAQAQTVIFTAKEVDEYITKGIYQTNTCSEHVLPILAEHYAYTITIQNIITGVRSRTYNYVIGSGGNRMNIVYTGVDDGKSIVGHYSQPKTGGGRSKFVNLVHDLRVFHEIAFDYDPMTIVEASAAPGDLSRILANNYPNATIYAMVYTGKGGYKWNKSNNAKNLVVVNYKDDREFKLKLRKIYDDKKIVDWFLCDAGRAVNTEALVDEFAKSLIPHINETGCAVFKTFANPREVWKLATNFRLLRPMTYLDTSEKYYFLSYNRTFEIADNAYFDSTLQSMESRLVDPTYDDCYNEYGQAETTHVCEVDIGDLRKFIKSYCGDIKEAQKFCNAKLDQVTTKKIHFEFKAITGYASASKTTDAYKSYPSYAFISPTKELTYGHSIAGKAAYTQHQPFIRKIKNDGFVVDECEAFSCEYLALLHISYNKPIVVIGDIYQVGIFDKKDYIATPLADIGVTNNKREVYKIPADITEMLNRKFGFDMVCKSDVVNGLRRLHTRLEDWKGKIICFNDNTAQDLRSQSLDASTITTYCGSRAEDVVFYIDSKAVQSQITTRPEYIYTAMTRAKNQLVLAGEAENVLKQYFMINGTAITTYEERSGLQVVADVDVPDEFPQAPVNMESGLAADQGANLTGVLDIANEEYINENEAFPTHASLVPTDYDDEPNDGQLTGPIDAFCHREVKQKAWRLLVEKTLAKNQFSNNVKDTVRTLKKRYNRVLPKMSQQTARLVASDIAVGLSRAVFGNSHSYSKLLQKLKPSYNDLNFHYRQYIKALQLKLNHNPAIFDELAGGFDDFNQILTFLNKRQTKYKPEDGYDTSDKVGQGVAAMSKATNLMFSAFARYMLTRFREIMREQGRPIMLATFDSEVDLNIEYTYLVQDAVKDGAFTSKWACNDFSEWDSSYRKPHVDVMWQLMLACGVQKDMADWFREYRQKWTMYYHSKLGTVKLDGTEKQFSGNPFTICENTIMNMGMCFAMFNYKNMKFAAFKGDDSAVCCDGGNMNACGTEMIAVTGHGIKLHVYEIGEFAGYFLTPYGMFPDVLRYAAKFLSKNYYNEGHFQEAINSLKERVGMVNSQFLLQYGCLATTEHYKTLNFENVRNVFYFLKNSINYKFADLTLVELPTLSDL